MEVIAKLKQRSHFFGTLCRWLRMTERAYFGFLTESKNDVDAILHTCTLHRKRPKHSRSFAGNGNPTL